MLVVMALIAVLVSLMLPAIQKIRAASNRTRCQSNLRQIGLACLNYEVAVGHLPRAGEHIWTETAGATGAGVGTQHKVQDLASTYALILPHLQGTYADYDYHFRYNQQYASGTAGNVATSGKALFANGGLPANVAVARQTPTIFYCPENQLANDRLAGKTDSVGFGCVDYIPLPYTQLNPDGTKNGETFWKTALTSEQYPDTIPMLPDNSGPLPNWNPATDQGVGVSASYKLYPVDADGYALNASPKNNKLWQLNVDDTTTSLNRLAFNGVAERYLIDAHWGGAKLSSITDGTAVTLLLGEDVGQSDKMLVPGYSNLPANQNASVDPLQAPAGIISTVSAGGAPVVSYHWRWANPEIASGQLYRINGAKNGGSGPPYNTPDPIDGCAWGNRDCGPNSEIFSFHGNGAHYVFADGHVAYIPETTTKAVLRALATRDQGKFEIAPTNFGD
jgi:prepilin-type processing-associated H-X9-DG protein